ncbi:competence type IV pilus ATPase ComGA [Leuconostocaceae bacterium ESL0723]|nr:competence type IV pilus ATPase ComGA [Leuconostocaceae bacterium ESL0723]
MDINQLLASASELGVSDVYILPRQGDFELSFHVDGHLEPVERLPSEAALRLIAAIKYRASMSISEGRRPQLGRFAFQNLWVRVSTVGDFLDRETVVLRLIYGEDQAQRWLVPQQFDELQASLPAAGLFLIAGPTGSGKTSTLYRILANLATEKMVLTIEDPVEVSHPEFVQLQVNEAAGITYTELIKVALRHRPEVLLIGEIRDRPTAQAAIQAALSGHLVLSTVHALSATEVPTRLQELGVDAGQLRAALQGVVYQRLLPIQAGGVAALADFWFKKQDRPVPSAWQAGLEAAYQKGVISAQTYQKYQKDETA